LGKSGQGRLVEGTSRAVIHKMSSRVSVSEETGTRFSLAQIRFDGWLKLDPFFAVNRYRYGHIEALRLYADTSLSYCMKGEDYQNEAN
jgi:hypothetical protein